MEKHYDIYITFPDGLADKQIELAETIKSHISNLTVIIGRILSGKPTILVKGENFNKHNYNQFFEQTSSFLFFVHPLFEKDEAYERELTDICNYLHLDQLDPVKGFSRIYKVNLEPIKETLRPYCIEELASYNFYEKSILNRKIKGLELGSKKSNLAIYGKLLDLAYDISAYLSENLGKKNKKTEQKGYIYLGLTNPDQQESRDDIRRELQQIGYRILPVTNMPSSEEEFKQVLIKYLDISDSIIQLMSTQYGDVPKGFKYSITDLQNRVINEYKANDVSLQPKYFIWMPANKIINDQRQSLHLKRVKHEEAGNHTEIIETPLESFKTILVNRLKTYTESRRVDYGNIFQVYLITEEIPSGEVDKLYTTLSSSGLKVLTLDYSEQVGIYARHLQKLRDCDSVIVYQQENNQFWLDSKIRDLIKSPGIGRLKPFKKVVIVCKSQPNAQLLSMIKTRLEVINNTKQDEELILNKLISE
jgi:hypothetical protein